MSQISLPIFGLLVIPSRTDVSTTKVENSSAKTGPLLIGYDVRTRVSQKNMAHDAMWREQYCLKCGAPNVFSADERIWPRPESLDLPDYFGPFGLCKSLDQLRADMKRNAAPDVGPTMVIALTFHGSNESISIDTTFSSLSAPHIQEWTFLGFDVVDFFVSALTNCGFDKDELAIKREKWSPRLNGYHLFDKLEDAIAFAEESNVDIPEHAPFAVVGLWQVATTDP